VLNSIIIRQYAIPNSEVAVIKDRFRVQGSGFRVQGSGFRVKKITIASKPEVSMA
jgi:hypothetical protein